MMIMIMMIMMIRALALSLLLSMILWLICVVVCPFVLQIEKIIVVAAKSKALSVRIDHGNECLIFSDQSHLESDHMRTQLTTLAQQMAKVVKIIQPEAEDLLSASSASLSTTLGSYESQRGPFFEAVRSSMAAEHEATLDRKNIIERRKEANERKEKELERMAEKQAEEAAKEKAAREKARLEAQAREREMEKKRKMAEEMRRMEVERELEKSGVSREKIKSVDMDNTSEMAKLQAKAVQEKANAEQEALKKKADQMKRLDHITRACREEEVALIQKSYDAQVKADRAAHEQAYAELKTRTKAKHEADVALKKEVAAYLACSVEFQGDVLKRRGEAHARNAEAARQRAFDEAVKQARRSKARAEAEAAAEEERLVREEQERQVGLLYRNRCCSSRFIIRSRKNQTSGEEGAGGGREER